MEIESSNLVGRLIVVRASPRMTNRFWKGVGRSPERFKFWWAPTMLLERLKLHIVQILYAGYVKSQHTDYKWPLKGAGLLTRIVCLSPCTMMIHINDAALEEQYCWVVVSVRLLKVCQKWLPTLVYSMSPWYRILSARYVTVEPT